MTVAVVVEVAQASCSGIRVSSWSRSTSHFSLVTNFSQICSRSRSVASLVSISRGSLLVSVFSPRFFPLPRCSFSMLYPNSCLQLSGISLDTC